MNELADLYRPLGGDVSLVAISENQRRSAADLNWAGTVHNAIDVSSFPFRDRKDDYVLFLGRFHADQGPPPRDRRGARGGGPDPPGRQVRRAARAGVLRGRDRAAARAGRGLRRRRRQHGEAPAPRRGTLPALPDPVGRAVRHGDGRGDGLRHARGRAQQRLGARGRRRRVHRRRRRARRASCPPPSSGPEVSTRPTAVGTPRRASASTPWPPATRRSTARSCCPRRPGSSTPWSAPSRECPSSEVERVPDQPAVPRRPRSPTEPTRPRIPGRRRTRPATLRNLT